MLSHPENSTRFWQRLIFPCLVFCAIYTHDTSSLRNSQWYPPSLRVGSPLPHPQLPTEFFLGSFLTWWFPMVVKICSVFADVLEAVVVCSSWTSGLVKGLTALIVFAFNPSLVSVCWKSQVNHVKGWYCKWNRDNEGKIVAQLCQLKYVQVESIWKYLIYITDVGNKWLLSIYFTK